MAAVVVTAVALDPSEMGLLVVVVVESNEKGGRVGLDPSILTLLVVGASVVAVLSDVGEDSVGISVVPDKEEDGIDVGDSVGVIVVIVSSQQPKNSPSSLGQQLPNKSIQSVWAEQLAVSTTMGALVNPVGIDQSISLKE